jgi:hypothetical protein
MDWAREGGNDEIVMWGDESQLDAVGDSRGFVVNARAASIAWPIRLPGG